MSHAVAASLWSTLQARQMAEAARLHAAGIERFHWDFADGAMSRAGGFDADRARALAPVGAAHEAHLMMRDPRAELAAWTPWCDAVAVHASQPFWRESLETIAAAGVLPVLAVTSEDELALAPSECGVLVMAITPGDAGGAFDERAYALVETAAGAGHGHVAVDGSMTAERGRRFAALGATVLVSGTALTSASDPAAWSAATDPRTAARPTRDATAGR